MHRLIDEFRTLRGDLKLDKKDYKIVDTVNEVVRDLGEDRLKGVVIDNSVDDSLTARVDPHYMYKVVQNIIINALEAMEGRGVLLLSAQEEGGFVCFSVKDTGKGMSQDFLQNRLFQPFSSTKEKGMGIGLFQCRTIVEAHGGSIAAESTKGEGTVFTVKMPKGKRYASETGSQGAKDGK